MNNADKNAIATAGGVVSGDIKLNVGSDLVRCLGCNDLATGKKVYTSRSNFSSSYFNTNVLSYSLPDSQLRVHIKIKTDGRFTS